MYSLSNVECLRAMEHDRSDIYWLTATHTVLETLASSPASTNFSRYVSREQSSSYFGNQNPRSPLYVGVPAA